MSSRTFLPIPSLKIDRLRHVTTLDATVTLCVAFPDESATAVDRLAFNWQDRALRLSSHSPHSSKTRDLPVLYDSYSSETGRGFTPPRQVLGATTISLFET